MRSHPAKVHHKLQYKHKFTHTSECTLSMSVLDHFLKKPKMPPFFGFLCSISLYLKRLYARSNTTGFTATVERGGGNSVTLFDFLPSSSSSTLEVTLPTPTPTPSLFLLCTFLLFHPLLGTHHLQKGLRFEYTLLRVHLPLHICHQAGAR
uniref:Uncharacterized protein n=1 Tax=Palpitomonas bilix TaxID=652834 RepID=A0A7S3GC55_9EUKA